LLITLKLLLPGNLAGVRGTVGQWLVRDADFTAAFSAVGRAVSGESGAIRALNDAYLAVLGQKGEAQEVSGSVDDLSAQDAVPEQSAQDTAPEQSAAESTLPARELPEQAAAEPHALSFTYCAPLNGKMTSPFGWREHPVTGAEAFHYGVDIAAEDGTAIACFADGTVGAVGESTTLGKYLTVNHADGVSTLYAHCSAISVPSGTEVSQGQKIAEVGHSGNATGPHLHFEVHDGEAYLDPAGYLAP
ncbi:MAG: M23 family metallopeptidase, partial [Oscillospiraceae bacterium]|nr:M23 family metallopeptidase [Oscillospiraceae bacterium]